MSQKTCLEYVRDLSEKKRTIHGNLGEKRDTPDQLQNWSGVFYFPGRKKNGGCHEVEGVSFCGRGDVLM